MYWWEEEKLLTERDREAIAAAKKMDWTEIDETSAETPTGRRWVHGIAMRKMRRCECVAGMQ